LICLLPIYGHARHLSDVLAGYAIGLGWGQLVEADEVQQLGWALLRMSDGRTMAGVEFHLRLD